MLVVRFFATRRAYQPGDIVRLGAGVQAPHLNGAAPSWVTMEQAVEVARPAGYPSRLSSRFACETMEECLTYYLPQPGGGAGRRVYRVFMNDPVAVPMVLTGCGQHHHASPATLAAIAQEYWTRQLHDWEYLEYLAPEMGVIDEILTPPDAVLLGSASFGYGNDLAMAKQIWP